MDGLAFVAAVVALLVAFGMRRKLAALQTQLAALTDELRSLRTQVAFGRPSAEQAPAPEAPLAQAGPAEAIPDSSHADDEPEAEPTPAAEDTPAAPAVAAPATTLEERLGTRWAVWVGGLALALGGVLLVRYSIEQGVFGPGVRVALGALFALALVAAGEWFRRSERGAPIGAIPAAHIPSILTAAGTISAFGTVYAAHALYQFIGPAAAFVMLGAIGIATMFAAALHGPALAGLGLAGSFVVPLLIESQQPNPWPLVIYLAVVAGAAYALARLRRWLWLAAATVAGAVIWGFALSGSVDLGGEALWSAALFVHVAIQLALAAAFMAIEPHLAVPDDAAEPDWIAAAALAALTVLAVLALGAARMDSWWMTFAVAAMAILAGDGVAQCAGRCRWAAGGRRRARRDHGLAWAQGAARAIASRARTGRCAAPARECVSVSHVCRARDTRRRRCGCAAALARTNAADTHSGPLCARGRRAAAAGARAGLPARDAVRPLHIVRAFRRGSGRDLLFRRRPLRKNRCRQDACHASRQSAPLPPAWPPP